MEKYTMPKWQEMTVFEKAMIVLEWGMVIAYVATFFISGFKIQTVTNYFIGGIFLTSGIAAFRTRRELSIINIVIAAIEIAIVTVLLLNK